MSVILWAATFVHAMFFAMTAVFVLRRRNFGIFSPLAWYLTFHGFVFVLVPVLSRASGVEVASSYMGMWFSDEDYMHGYVVTDLALIAYAAGYLANRGLQTTACARLEDFDRVAFCRSVKVATALIVPVAVYSGFQTIGGFTFTHYDPSESPVVMELVNGVAINTNQVGYLVEFKNTLTPMVFLLCVALRFNSFALALAGAYISYRLFLGWQRIHAVVLLAQMLLFYLFVRGKRWPPLAVIPIAVISLPVFSILGTNRDLIRTWFFGTDSGGVEFKSLSEMLGGLDFANFEYLLYILKVVPERSGTYTFGTQYLQLLTEPIPRMLWPGKPIGPPVNLVDLMEYGNFLGLTKSVVGDAWLNLGWIGVAVTMGVLGYATGAAYRRLFLRGSYIAQLAWISALPYSIQLFRDGGIVSIARFLIFALVPVVLTALLYSRSRRSQ